MMRKNTLGKGNGIAKVEKEKILRHVQKLKKSSVWMEYSLCLECWKISLERVVEARSQMVLSTMLRNWYCIQRHCQH